MGYILYKKEEEKKKEFWQRKSWKVNAICLII